VSVAVSLSQLALAVVFAVAGTAKLADLSGTRRAIEGFGAPPHLSPVAAVLLPIAELAIGAALLPPATARWGALAAIALLATFSLAIVRALRSGAALDCNCFGGLAQTEVGRGTLIRNLLLGLLAAFVALGGESVGAFSWVTVPAPGDRLVIVALIVSLFGLGCFCWLLLRQNGELLLRLDALDGNADPRAGGKKAPSPLAVGAAAPEFSGRDIGGEPISLRSLLATGRPVALFFTDPGCGACELVLDAVASAQRDRAEDLTVAVLSSGKVDRIEEKAAEFGLDRVVPQDGEALLDSYGVNGFPAIVLIDEQGLVARPAALGVDAVRDIVLESSSVADLVGLATR
jgi:hypothetical protein